MFSRKNTRIVLEGEPKSTQHIYKTTCRNGYSQMYMTIEGKALKDRYKWEAKSQWTGTPIEKRIGAEIHFYVKTKRRFDLDNQNKLILDALTGIAYDDDSQLAELHLYKHYDKENPRIEIDIKLV